MPTTVKARGGTQGSLLRELLRSKAGLTIDALAVRLEISRNAVRQHLLSAERDGLVTRRAAKRAVGRPEHVYILTAAGAELFPRQYSWMSELLLQSLQRETGPAKLERRLGEMGRETGAGLKAQLPGAPGSKTQLAALAKAMTGMGYDAAAVTSGGKTVIEAHNCVFHKLAVQYPQVCRFDTALLESSTGCGVEHRACMAKGGDACRFHFMAPKVTIK
jgi:predicted ArsR family transcriptional regulator